MCGGQSYRRGLDLKSRRLNGKVEPFRLQLPLLFFDQGGETNVLLLVPPYLMAFCQLGL